jgi:hypothetical protein
MKCHRCSGMMIHEKFYGYGEHFWGWKCIYCGEVFDETVLENRNGLGRSGIAQRRWTRNVRFMNR